MIIKKILFQTIRLSWLMSRKRWFVRVRPWGISLLVHVALAVGLILFSKSISSPPPQVVAAPQSILEEKSEPLQMEPLINDFQMEPLVENDRPQPLEPVDLPEIPEPAPPVSDIISVAESDSLAPDLSNAFVTKPNNYHSQFCGAGGAGQRIGYVVDCSGSMVIAFDYVRRELKSTINRLTPAQYFQIVFYAGGSPLRMSPDKLLRAHAPNRKKALEFIDQADLGSVADRTAAWKAVVNAMQAVFHARTPSGYSCQLIYFLTDGEFDHARVEQAIAQMQRQREQPARINVISCGNPDNEKFLRKLAASYKGKYRFVSDEELAQTQKIKTAY